MKDNNNTRYHFINMMKVSKDFLGERLTPLSESDCGALCARKDVIDSLNAALKAAGIGLRVQLNWSSDQGSSWIQYPKR